MEAIKRQMLASHYEPLHQMEDGACSALGCESTKKES